MNLPPNTFWTKKIRGAKGYDVEELRVLVTRQTHEFGHALEENNSHIAKRCREYLDYRTRGEHVVSMNEAWLDRASGYMRQMYPNGIYEPYEMTKPDKFFEIYCGKQYSDGSTEILSMGIEELVTDPVKFYSKDPEYFRFVLMLIRGEI